MGRLRRQANQQARAEYQPQIAGVHRDAASEAASLQSMEAPLTQGYRLASKQLRHAGLSQHDLSIALDEFANRTAEIPQSVQSQIGAVNRNATGQISDLRAAQGASAASLLTQLRNAAAEQQAAGAAEEAGNVEDFKMDILKEQTLKELGLGSYADDGGQGGLTPTQRRDAKETHYNAAFYAKQLFSSVRGVGAKDEKTGEYVIPPDPGDWDDSIWNGLVEKVASQSGGDVRVAGKAIQAIRDHVDGGGQNPLDVLSLLGQAAGGAASAGLFGQPAQKVAQFAGSLRR